MPLTIGTGQDSTRLLSQSSNDQLDEAPRRRNVGDVRRADLYSAESQAAS